MSTTIYLIRHAQAEGNVKKLFQGHYDGKITALGHQQLACLRTRFQDVPLDAVYSSPLSRALTTAQAVSRDPASVIPLEDLCEINGGKFEGQYYETLQQVYAAEFATFANEPHLFQAPDGEAMEQVYSRMVSCIGTIAQRHAGKEVAIVSHGCAIRSYLCFAGGYPLSQMNQLGWCDNTAVNRIDYDSSGKPTIVYSNDSAHLPPHLHSNYTGKHQIPDAAPQRSI